MGFLEARADDQRGGGGQEGGVADVVPVVVGPDEGRDGVWGKEGGEGGR